MQFPKRVDSHISETESWRLLHELAPQGWIIREASERDYGVDAYIEITSDTGQVTGNIIAAQLKSVSGGLSWSSSEPDAVTSSPSINISTINYWLNLPMPVVLFYADLQERIIYFEVIKNQIRQKYEKVHSQQTMSFTMHRALQLRKTPENPWFNMFTNMERNHGRFASELQSLLTSMDNHRDFILNNLGRDCHLPVEDDVIAQMIALYTTCGFLANQMMLNRDQKPFGAYFVEDAKIFNDGYQLHELTLTEILRKMAPTFYYIIKRGLNLICVEQESYWKNYYPSVHFIAHTDKYAEILAQSPEDFYGCPRHLLSWPDF